MVNILAFCLNLVVFQQDTTGVAVNEFQEVLTGYKQLLVEIREQKNTPDESKAKFQDMMLTLKHAFPMAYYDSAQVSIFFPLKGIDYRAVGGRGMGYRSKGFNLFDYSKKSSHPAHDIFIRDVNKDGKDDRIDQYIEVLSVGNGLVLATEEDWQKDSEYRGGNYIWIYDTDLGGLWYYAHQQEIFVKSGDYVKAGQPIAYVGRTGYNASMKRSDTHLHLTFLRLDEESTPRPVNTYGWLKNAIVTPNPDILAYREVVKPKTVPKKNKKKNKKKRRR